MAKIIVLEEGADCITIRNSGSTSIKTIPYTAIEQLDKRYPMDAPPDSSDMGGYIIILSGERETKIYYDQVLTPSVASLDALYSEIWSWVYSDAAPTPAPTTAAPTTL